MSIYGRKLRLPLPWTILILMIVLALIFLYFTRSLTEKSFFDKEGPFWIFAAGLVPGLVVAIIQFVLSWWEFQEIEEFRNMKIKGVLSSRDEEAFYRKLIKNAQTQIDVLGVTASRFMRDFADVSDEREEKKVLIEALKNGIVVRILIPKIDFLNQNSAEKFPSAKRAFDAVSNLFPNFQVRYFNHIPFSSIVKVDDDVLVGPYFNNQESGATPAVHTTSGSALAKSYLRHFELEWTEAQPLEIGNK